jgi:glycosyltransferase involved in cell wall biosynthesis
MTIQLVRAWPPGYGGVERVAHEIGNIKGWRTYSFAADAKTDLRTDDPLPVRYPRVRLPALNHGKLTIPMASLALLQLLRSPEPLLAHLPCPASLAVCLLARLIRPNRPIVVYWHAFLNRHSKFIGLYEEVAIQFARKCTQVITTSPILRRELQQRGCPREAVLVLPCCISEASEAYSLAVQTRRANSNKPLQVLSIGRLDSYKRIDWLIEAADAAQRHLGSRQPQFILHIVGDGPRRATFEAMATRTSVPVQFWGRLSEADKQTRIVEADVLVLPSDTCNEAFGIVQLEAMAAGMLSLAFSTKDSGMGWVCDLPDLQWSQNRNGLAAVLIELASDRQRAIQLGEQARQRYRQLFARSTWVQTMLSMEC